MTTPLVHADKLLVNAQEAARLAGISERHWWALHSSGRIGPRPIALGRAKRWSVRELENWIAAGAPGRDRWEAILAAERKDSRS